MEVLLHRCSRGAVPTAAGAVLTEWAQRLLGCDGEVDLAIASLRADARAHLAGAASMTVAEHLLPRGWWPCARSRWRPVRCRCRWCSPR